MPPDFPQNQLHIIEFKRVSENKTELMITEYDWSFGQMMEMSKKALIKLFSYLCTLKMRRRYNLNEWIPPPYITFLYTSNEPPK